MKNDIWWNVIVTGSLDDLEISGALDNLGDDLLDYPQYRNLDVNGRHFDVRLNIDIEGNSEHAGRDTTDLIGAAKSGLDIVTAAFDVGNAIWIATGVTVEKQRESAWVDQYTWDER